MQLDIKVDGMNCMGCVTALLAKLRTLDGVEFADIDLSSSTAMVTFNEQVVSLNGIRQAIRESGYKVLE
ncbi:MAG: heavy-metal-associated domain-containing protein [Firmicutes bacterium]|nr:heavy-metal-associated domain-containing protein [Bacillota bacterium]MDD4264269.1 heavy-metal-associated domain-containing protein [Bacillota bacterium]MDD4692825.1 heavy-metal-associated domain-containing protein [Bacillota bacterium]